MASSNRHWPSMFKSKPCNSNHQWQHDINSALVSSNACQRTTPYAASSGCEERSPEPKPRWNPRPEQIRILEAIFNSGMVNPPRDEIRKIRAQLQEYGQVGDANVFYWFQNRKSRSKHKQRHGHTNGKLSQPTKTAALSSSSSSSEKSSQNSADKILSLGSRNVVEHASSSPTASVNQPFFQPFFFPVQPPPPAAASLSQGLCFPDPQNSTNLLLSDLLLMNHAPTKKMDDDDNGDEDDRVKLHHHQQPLSAFTMSSASAQSQSTAFSTTTNSIALSTIDHIQGFVGENGSSGPIKPTVFINDVAFEVTSAPFNVREAFGDDAMLLNSSGQPVLTNEWGVTLQPLQHGAFYYLIRTLTSPQHDTTIHLI